MPFTGLNIDDLPIVLAGPILRRVAMDNLPDGTIASVTVWLALRKRATVELSVHDTDSPDRHTSAHVIMQGSRETTRLGVNLHVVAVTARNDGRKPFSPGHIYFYDLSFTVYDEQHPGGLPTTFLDAVDAGGLQNPYAYPPLKLPSFALPPAVPEQLRLYYGSCRKPHGPYADALPTIHNVIANSCTSPVDRPHQLILSGDQIYADDVADVLSHVIMDIDAKLMGAEELLPKALGNGTFTAADFPATTRQSLIKGAGLTSDAARSHLLTLGEWMAMYLLSWSEELWPDDLPTWDDLEGRLRQVVPDERKKSALSYLGAIYNSVKDDRVYVEGFKASMVNIRKALANVPTYMILDDHEVTDDWNMTREFCTRVYSNPLGLRIVQNALVAYNLCQAWGNTPEQFEVEGPAFRPAGHQLLGLLNSETTPNHQFSAAVQKLVGLQPHSNLLIKTPYGLYHEPELIGPLNSVNGFAVTQKSLRYHYTIEGPAHQVLVTDSRTWRSFPEPGPDLVTPPDLIPDSQLVEQIGQAPPTGNRLLLVVLTTNAPPIPGIRTVEAMSKTSRFLDNSDIYDKDLYDSWRLGSAAFDRLVSRLADRFQPRTDGARRGRVVLLSGDVHSSWASRLMYWSRSRFGVDTPGAPWSSGETRVVFAQLISSSLKNPSAPTFGQHLHGFKFVPKWIYKAVRPGYGPEGLVGWNVQAPTVIGIFPRGNDGGSDVASAIVVKPEHPSLSIATLELTIGAGAPVLQRPADYRYRLDNITATDGWQNHDHPETPPPVPPFGTGTTAQERKKSLAAYTQAARKVKNNIDRMSGRQIVGVSNLAELRFTWPSNTDFKEVHQTVTWVDSRGNDRWVRFSVSLTLDDETTYPRIRMSTEPGTSAP
jgi:hypothetical protein